MHPPKHSILSLEQFSGQSIKVICQAFSAQSTGKRYLPFGWHKTKEKNSSSKLHAFAHMFIIHFQHQKELKQRYLQSMLTIHFPPRMPCRYFIVRGHWPSGFTLLTTWVTATSHTTHCSPHGSLQQAIQHTAHHMVTATSHTTHCSPHGSLQQAIQCIAHHMGHCNKPFNALLTTWVTATSHSTHCSPHGSLQQAIQHTAHHMGHCNKPYNTLLTTWITATSHTTHCSPHGSLQQAIQHTAHHMDHCKKLQRAGYHMDHCSVSYYNTLLSTWVTVTSDTNLHTSSCHIHHCKSYNTSFATWVTVVSLTALPSM